MRCNQCHHDDTKVIESRDVSNGESIRRRRECPSCNTRFTTYERLERPHLVVVKHNGTRELFNREKLLSGLLRACEKTTMTTMQIEDIVSDIERQLYSCGESEITSTKVGDIVMDKLADKNEVAYVRFASVYRRFKDIESFEKELSQIRKHQTERAKV
ncbi:transcriptional regulator NrdR [Candidatus Saccharibacteria bacterium]|nr:transcriptional regulator NrdR [Candidatus Saccharibacteria bacterium]